MDVHVRKWSNFLNSRTHVEHRDCLKGSGDWILSERISYSFYYNAEFVSYLILLKGYYVSATQTKQDLLKEDMYDVMLKEMTIGCEEYPDVKTGFIGEVGSTWPITRTYLASNVAPRNP